MLEDNFLPLIKGQRASIFRLMISITVFFNANGQHPIFSEQA
jgi:hypothetical protein